MGVENSQHSALFLERGVGAQMVGCLAPKNEGSSGGAGGGHSVPPPGPCNKFPIPATNVLLIPVNIVTTPFCGGFPGGNEKRRKDRVVEAARPPFF